MREVIDVIPDLLSMLDLSTKILLVIIRHTPGGVFQIMDEAYGDTNGLKMYLVHSGSHFFLACPLFGSEKAKVS